MVDDAVIIAIYTGKIACADHYDVFIPMVAKALFPVGDPQLRVPIHPSSKPVTETWASKPDIAKYNGARIETAEFTKSENAPISAVLYATDHMLRMFWEPAAPALSLIHNPLATAPVPRAMLPLRREMWVETDGRWSTAVGAPESATTLARLGAQRERGRRANSRAVRRRLGSAPGDAG